MSLYSAQKGKDPITGNLLIESLEVHHILPKSQGGQDNYENLILINENTVKSCGKFRYDRILS